MRRAVQLRLVRHRRDLPGHQPPDHHGRNLPDDPDPPAVIAQVAGLVVEHRLDQAPQQFIGFPAAGGFALQQIGQPVQPEQFPVRGPRLGHPVGVQQHHVIRLKLLNAWLRGGRAAATAAGARHTTTPAALTRWPAGR